MTRGKIAARLALAASALTLAAGLAQAQDGYRVGMSIDLTGPISFNGKIAAAGFEAYVARLNDAGGVNGRRIDLTVLDDASDLAKGKANVQRFSDDGALAVFGFILSSVSAAAAPEAEEDEIPLIALGGLTELLEPPRPYYFSYELRAAKLSDRILSYIDARAAQDGIAKPRIAVMVVDVPSNRQVAESAAAAIAERGWELVATEYFAVQPTDVTAQAAAIRDAKPDYVLMSHNDGGALVGVRGLRSAGITVPIINQWAGSADATFERLGEGYIAFRTFTSPTDASLPAIAEVRAAGEKFGYADQMTNPYFTQGYVGGMILEKALEICGADCGSGADFARAVEQIGAMDTAGLSGPLSVGPETHEFVEYVRFHTWDAASKSVVPVTDWIGPDE